MANIINFEALIHVIVSEQQEDHFKKQIKIDEDSFFDLYQRYWKKLYLLAYKYLGDIYPAECMVQEVFTSLWQRKDQIILHEATVENYLVKAIRFRIARSYSDDARKQRKMDELQNRQLNSTHHTEEQVLYNFLRSEIDELVSHLPERCKEVYELSRNKGLNNREIAGNLLISEKTVENQLTKALKFLRKGLGKYPLG